MGFFDKLKGAAKKSRKKIGILEQRPNVLITNRRFTETSIEALKTAIFGWEVTSVSKTAKA